MLTALRGSVQSLGLRTFSATPAAAAARDEPSAAPKSRSSTSSLLSLNRPSRRVPREGNKSNNERGPPPGDAAARLLNRYKQRGRADAASLESAHNYLREQKIANDYLRQMPRRWQIGDVYAPHDLSPAEMNKWRRKKMRQADVVDMLGIRPQDMYKVSRARTQGEERRLLTCR